MKNILYITLILLLQCLVPAAEKTSSNLTLHEWGTFTSVQGSDGTQMEWNPLQAADLPSFVYDLNRTGKKPTGKQYAAFASKTAMFALQRMETPVIYFYASTDQAVRLRVDFPQGTITEWFPQASEIGSLLRSNRGRENLKSYLLWDNLKLHADARSIELPNDKSQSHYYPARETDSLAVSVSNQQTNEFEKFLFYRGVGFFQAPLHVSLPSATSLQVENRGDAPLNHFLVYQLRQDEGAFFAFPTLAPGEKRLVHLSESFVSLPKSELLATLTTAMQSGLEAEGLYPREASAMTASWKDSWFGEDGLRVLYTLPQTWADKTLPLSVEPQPKSTVRVMVGRAEMITPSMESQLHQLLLKFGNASESEQTVIAGEARKLNLGRFAEPAMRRVMHNIKDKKLNTLAWVLLEQMNKPASPEKIALAH